MGRWRREATNRAGDGDRSQAFLDWLAGPFWNTAKAAGDRDAPIHALHTVVARVSTPSHKAGPACEKCGGTGKLGYDIAPSGDSMRVGDVVIEDGGGWGTRACPCVRDLPATDGHASWWESETIQSTVVGVPIFNECVEVEATCEILLAEINARAAA